MFKAIKKSVSEYVKYQQALNRIACLLPAAKATKEDVYRLASIAAYLGYKPNDYNAVVIGRRKLTFPAGPFRCRCDFIEETQRKLPDEFWTYYGAPPEAKCWDSVRYHCCGRCHDDD